MAIAHSLKAGQWAKKRSRDIHVRTFMIYAAACWLVAASFGFASGYTVRNAAGIGAIWGILAILAAGVGAIYVMRWVDRRFEEKAIERLRYLRGGQAEALVSMCLRRGLCDDWHLFDNVKLGAKSDVDHVVIGSKGMFVLSTKSSRGLLRVVGGECRMNDQPIDWHRRAKQQALRLRDQLSVLTDDPLPFVQPVLAVPFAYVDLPGRPPQTDGVWVLNEENLADSIESGTEPLSGARVKAAVAALEELVQRRGHIAGAGADPAPLREGAPRR